MGRRLIHYEGVMPMYLLFVAPRKEQQMSIYEALTLAISFAMLVLYIDRDKDKKR